MIKKLQKNIYYSSLSLKEFFKKGLFTIILLGISHFFSFAGGGPDCVNYGNGNAANIVYKVNGVVVGSLSGVVSGDTVTICFDLTGGSNPTLFSLVSYKAPSATFDPNTAALQTIFDADTKVISQNGGCLTVVIPPCYFQLDFVMGCPIEQFGPSGSTIFYSAQGRLISSTVGGNGTCNCVADADAGADLFLNCTLGQATLSGSTHTHNPTINWTATGGGNIVSGGTMLNPVVNASGTYVLSVTDTLNCIAYDTVKVSGTLLVLDLGRDTVLCAGDSIILDADNTGSNYYWNTGEASQTITVDTTGTYYVTITNGNCFISDTIHVTVLPPVMVDLGPDTTITLCVGNILLDAGNGSLNYTYTWSTGATTQTITVNSSGLIWVTETNTAGCSATDSIQVTINPGIINVDLGNDTTITTCTHATLTLDAGIIGHYTWSTGDTTQTIVVDSTGTYYVTVVDNHGCTDSDTINVIIIDNSVDVDLGRDTTVCQCIVLNAGSPNNSFLWCSGQNYPSINACATGMYCVTVSNGTCIGTDTIHITINPPPVVNLGNDTTVNSNSIILDAGNAGATFLWSTGATTQTISVSSSGQYWVTVTDGFGCIGTDTINVNMLITVQENSIAPFSINVYPNPSIDNSFTLSFNVQDQDNVEIKILNVLGLVVYSENLEKFKGAYSKKITVENLAGGIYFANVRKGSSKSITKITLH